MEQQEIKHQESVGQEAIRQGTGEQNEARGNERAQTILSQI